MADKSVRIFDTENQEYIDIKVTDNGDGTYSQDSSSATEGTTDDSAVVTDTTGTISGKLRGIVALLAGILKVGGNVTAGSTDSGNPVKVGGVYKAAPATRTDGQRSDLVTDANENTLVSLATAIAGEDLTNSVLGVQNKPVASGTYSPSLYAPLTQVTKNVIKASAGNVLSIYITNDNAAVRYFQLHNKATAPAGADVPIRSLKVPAGTANNPGVLVLGREFFGDGGQFFSTGIGWAISTTLATFTDSATNTEHIVNIDYI